MKYATVYTMLLTTLGR